MEEIEAIGKSLEKEILHRSWGHRDIGDPGDKVLPHFEIANHETLTRREVPPCGPLLARRERREAPFVGANYQPSGESGFKGSRILRVSAIFH
jgi:hypothetical protein